MFSQVSVRQQGRGYPCSLVPLSGRFPWGGGGGLLLVLSQPTPPPQQDQDRGTPSPWKVMFSQVSVCSQGRGTPAHWSLVLSRGEGATPSPVTPFPEQDQDKPLPLPRTGHSAGGTPLAVTQEDFLVAIQLNNT